MTFPGRNVVRLVMFLITDPKGLFILFFIVSTQATSHQAQFLNNLFVVPRQVSTPKIWGISWRLTNGSRLRSLRKRSYKLNTSWG